FSMFEMCFINPLVRPKAQRLIRPSYPLTLSASSSLLLHLPSMLPDQAHEPAPSEILPLHVIGVLGETRELDQVLRVAPPDGDHQAAPDGKLLHQRPRDGGRPRGDQDGV